MIRKALTGLALAVSLYGCQPVELPAEKGGDGRPTLGYPAICQEVTQVHYERSRFYSEWQLNCMDVEGKLRYFTKYDDRSAEWRETVLQRIPR